MPQPSPLEIVPLAHTFFAPTHCDCVSSHAPSHDMGWLRFTRPVTRSENTRIGHVQRRPSVFFFFRTQPMEVFYGLLVLLLGNYSLWYNESPIQHVKFFKRDKLGPSPGDLREFFENLNFTNPTLFGTKKIYQIITLSREDENHTLSTGTSPYRPYTGEPPRVLDLSVLNRARVHRISRSLSY